MNTVISRVKTGGKTVLQNAPRFLCHTMMALSMLSTVAYATNAGQDLENAITKIANSVYSLIVGVSTVTAGVVIAWCLFTMLLSKEERKVSASMDWLKRAVVCWAAIFLVSTFLKWIVSATGLINRNATLDVFGGGTGTTSTP